MWHELFRIPVLNAPVYGYGLMLVIGFFAATYLAKYLAGRVGMDGEIFVNAALIALLAGMVGARLSHVLENWSQYSRGDRTFWQNLLDAVNIRSGGLTYYGGFLLAFAAVLGYGIWKKVPVRLGMDVIAPCLMLGLGFGRIGCFTNGCCYGAQCDVPGISVRFPYYSNAYVEQYDAGALKNPPPPLLTIRAPNRPAILLPPESFQADAQRLMLAEQTRANPVIAAELLSAATAFLLCGLLLAFFTLSPSPGRVFALMLLLEPASRFILELLRVEPAVAGLMSLSMLLSLPQIALGAVLWWAFRSNRAAASVAQLAGDQATSSR